MSALWEKYGSGGFSNKVGTFSSVATSVLAACGIPQGMHEDPGGILSGVDIKRMDALSAIKVSLFERVVDNLLLEMVVDENGSVRFKKVGDSTAAVTDIYFTSQSYEYKSNSKTSAVLVTGGVPLPERKVGTFVQLLSALFKVKYWEADVISSACAMASLKRFVTITYNDPHLESSYDDGIDNLYEVSGPFESVLGYVYDVDAGTTDPYVEITFSNKATVPIKLSGIGTLALSEYAAADYTGEHEDCLRGLGNITSCGNGSVVIEIPSELRYDDRILGSMDKFLGVSGVYVVGYKVAYGLKPAADEHALTAPTADNVGIWIAPEDTTRDIIKLTEGKNYAVGYDNGTVCVQFADRSPLDMQGVCGAAVEVNIPAWSAFHDTFKQTVDLLPLDETEAVVVTEVWASIDVLSPCINIFDPKGAAMEIAQSMSIKIAPISIIKEPAPVALNGNIINQKDGVVDHDPTTSQDFSDTDMELSMEEMDGKIGMSVSMSCFTSEGKVATFSKNLSSMYDEDNGIGTVYSCGPGVGYVEIGDAAPDGGVVNSVEYRYNDSASYTVSVRSGSKFASNYIASISNGTYVKRDESVTVEGVIIQDVGSGGHYKVRLEGGLGIREAINGTMHVLRVGDIVNVAIHNNPVEA